MLWHMHSEILKGFYASEVFISAETKDQAVQLGLDAYDRWLNEQVEEYYFDPLTANYDPDEKGYALEAADVRQRFMAELREKLEPQPHSAMIFRRT